MPDTASETRDQQLAASRHAAQIVHSPIHSVSATVPSPHQMLPTNGTGVSVCQGQEVSASACALRMSELDESSYLKPSEARHCDGREGSLSGGQEQQKAGDSALKEAKRMKRCACTWILLLLLLLCVCLLQTSHCAD